MSTVRVKMRKTAAGPDGPHQEGREYEIEAGLAAAYLSDSACELLDAPVEQATAEPDAESGQAEAAEAPPVRTTVKRRAPRK